MIRLLPETLVAIALLLTACERASSSGPPDKIAQSGVASFYGLDSEGQKTANGEKLKLDAMTAASRTLPLGSQVQVTNAETGQSAKVRINDRGPYAKGRVIDLTPTAAQHIGIDKNDGVGKVLVEPIPAPRGSPSQER